MNLGTNLLQYAKSIGIDSQKGLAKKVQENEKTISSYITEKSYPTYKKLVKLCKMLKCDPNTLMSGDFENTSDGVDQQKQQIFSAYRNLKDSDKKIVDFILGIGEYDASKVKVTESKIIYRFPIFYQSAAAGIGRLSETDDYQMKEFKLKSIPSKAVFGMFIEGHSMETIIYENDIVLIDPSAKEYSKLDGEIVIARFGEELICKRFSVNEDEQTYDFTSENPDDKDKGRYNQKQNNFTLVGKVVKIIHAHETGFGIFSYDED